MTEVRRLTVNELAALQGFSPVVIDDGEREIGGIYIGDLLSWVMGRAGEDNAWITIMTNINVVAVASLSDVACVILAEGTAPDNEVLTTAEEKGVNLISSPLGAYEIAVKLSSLI